MAKGKEFPLSIVLRAVDRFTAPMRRMNARVATFFKPFEVLRQRMSGLVAAAHLDKLTARARAFGDSLRSVYGRVTSIGKRLAVMSAAVAGLGIGMVASFARAGDQAKKTALRLGISVEALQEYRYAAERAGIPTATFDMAMQRMGRRVGEAAAGMGEARIALNALGISAVDANGKVRSIEEMLPELADKLSKVESENVRNALAMKLFDSEGVAMVQMLDGGSQGLARMRADARDLGLVIDHDAAASAENFTDQMSRMRGAMLGVRNVIGNALLPRLTDLVVRLTDLVVGNRDRVEQWAQNFASGLPDRLRRLRDWLANVRVELRVLFGPVEWLIDRFGALRTMVGAVALVYGGPLLVALGQASYAFAVLGVALTRSLTLLTVGMLPAIKASVAWMAKMAVTLTASVIPAVWRFTVALLANPLVRVLTVATALVVAFLDMVGLLDRIGEKFQKITGIVPDWVKDLMGGKSSTIEVNGPNGGGPTSAANARSAATGRLEEVQRIIERQEQTVRLEFENLPEGVRVSTSGDNLVEMREGPAMRTL